MDAEKIDCNFRKEFLLQRTFVGIILEFKLFYSNGGNVKKDSEQCSHT